MKQLKLFKQRGGKRKGAGRKKIHPDLLPHTKRPQISKNHPMHITCTWREMRQVRIPNEQSSEGSPYIKHLTRRSSRPNGLQDTSSALSRQRLTIKLKKGVKTLRKKSCYEIFRNSIKKALQFGLHVVHFSVQANHIHLIVEAKNRQALSKGMKSLTIRLARGVNNLHGTSGKIFKDRYHLHILRTPTEVKEALKYVFKNTAKVIKGKNIFDPYSTIIHFKESKTWPLGELIDSSGLSQDKLDWFRSELKRILSPPTSFLLTKGWKRAKRLNAQKNSTFNIDAC